MWTVVARIILRNRIYFLIAIGLLTAFMVYKAKDVRLSYQYIKMLPENDSSSIKYRAFKNQFGEDGTVLGIAVKDSSFFTYQKLNEWYDLGNHIKQIQGVNEVLSVTHLYLLKKNQKLKKFEIDKVLKGHLKNQAEADQFKSTVLSLPFYDQFLLNDSANVYLLAITLDKEELNSKKREKILAKIKKQAAAYGENHDLEIHFSGMPFIRTEIANMIRHELLFFIVLAALICIIVLFSFFRSVKVTFFSMLIVSIAVVFALGSIVLFGFEITILSAIIPPLIIVIGIPNSIFLLNKYHHEYKQHGNKIKALQRVIQKVGNATFLTNLTTASGFSTFIITKSAILTEFGIIASINVMVIFVLSILLIPIIFSFLPPPKERHTKHLDYTFVRKFINKLVHITLRRRPVVYTITALVIVAGFVGIYFIKTTGYIVDDISKKHPIYMDLKFFEKNFNGVIPFEIVIDTKKRNGAIASGNLRKVEKLQQELTKYPELSKPISFNEVVKYAQQTFRNGLEKHYRLPKSYEQNFLTAYIKNSSEVNKDNLLRSYIDSTNSKTRLSYNILDVGTARMETLTDSIRQDIDRIFSPEKYDITVTGTSVVYFKGTNYLIKNLFLSLALAILIISFILFWMFTTFRMVVFSLIPNIIPLLLTAALMGYFNIPIKPSTILVFSIAFGISVDGTIHFLAKFRQDLKATNWDIGRSVVLALRETGVSIFYTTIVLFFGFGIFFASEFGGTKALGILISVTLLNAMLANLILLPSLLLTLEKSITKESFHEPLLQIFDEEEDIELDELKIKSNSTKNNA